MQFLLQAVSPSGYLRWVPLASRRTCVLTDRYNLGLLRRGAIRAERVRNAAFSAEAWRRELKEAASVNMACRSRAGSLMARLPRTSRWERCSNTAKMLAWLVWPLAASPSAYHAPPESLNLQSIALCPPCSSFTSHATRARDVGVANPGDAGRQSLNFGAGYI